MKPTIRYLSDFPQFIPNCANWAFEAWGKYNPAVTFAIRCERFKEHCNRDKIPLTLIALNSDDIIGMASLRLSDGLKTDLFPWLGSVYVDAKYRGQGIGKLLIERIEEEAWKLGHKKLYLLTFEPSLSMWYASLGWNETGKDFIGGNPVMVMAKDIHKT